MSSPIDRLESAEANRVRDFYLGPEYMSEEVTPEFLVEMLCRTQEMVFRSPAMPRYPSHAADCFCKNSAGRDRTVSFENDGEAVRYIMKTVVSALIDAEALFKPCVVENCNQEAVVIGTVHVPGETIGDAETPDTTVEVGFCAEHMNSIIGDSTKGLSLG